MKLERFERLRKAQKAYHRRCKWVMKNGIYVIHSYDEKKPDDLSWWSDAGFILGDRRVMVWWQHPRFVYAEALDEQARQEAGHSPVNGRLFDDGIPNHKPVGRSRKKIISYTVPPGTDETRQYYDRLDTINQRLQKEGMDFTVKPCWQRECLSWATGVELVAPLEVRNETELENVIDLANRLLRGQTTLEHEFPGYAYGREQWLQEQDKR
ncbi:hypothetical protein KU392_04345 [Advenella alkanexedens]|uniref:Uncharacterized protein n=1 Tax=Advenella alkanexedens TaxID=1481665 RepID=A0ABS6NLI6_9BURK|nr:hypothetical protein [Advenella alkanexedens]MBV4396489.1 hypothetical protein [Advenella alkanexedens]